MYIYAYMHDFLMCPPLSVFPQPTRLAHSQTTTLQLQQKESESRSVMSNQLFGTPWAIQPIEFSRPTEVGNLSLLQGIFPTQGSNHISWIAGRLFTS